MKKRTCVVLGCIMLFVVIVSIVSFVSIFNYILTASHSKDIEKYINENIEVLELCVKEIDSLDDDFWCFELLPDGVVRAHRESSWVHYEDYTNLENTEKILSSWRIHDIQKKENAIIFSWNILEFTRNDYFDFYYSVDNQPVNLMKDEELIQYDNEAYVWLEATGDNCVYTRRLRDNWFYHEQHY